MRGDGLVAESDLGLRTESKQTRIVLSIHPLTEQTDRIESWVAAVTKQTLDSDAIPLNAAREAHSSWWEAFWDKSWIQVSGTPEAEVVSRAYKLQRFINACGGRGASPIKFNGSIFTVDADEPNTVFDADFRRWGGGYWFF